MEEIICYCKNILKSEIEDAVLNGAKTLKDIRETTGACTGNQCELLNPKGRCCSFEILGILYKKEAGPGNDCL